MRVSLVWHLPLLGTSLSFMFHFWLFYSLFHCSHPSSPIPSYYISTSNCCEYFMKTLRVGATSQYPLSWMLACWTTDTDTTACEHPVGSRGSSRDWGGNLWRYQISNYYLLRFSVVILQGRQGALSSSPSICAPSTLSIYYLTHFYIARYAAILFKKQKYVSGQHRYLSIYKLPNQKFWSRLYSLWVFFCR